MVKVLFVCLGNICRSPTAHGVFQKIIDEAGLGEQFYIASAGTGAWHVGEAPDSRAQAAAAQRGYDLSRLRAQQVNAGDFEMYDYILAMDHNNLSDLFSQCPDDLQSKIHLLLAFSDMAHDEVPDPYYGGKDGFTSVLELVESAGQGLLEHIRRHDLGDSSAAGWPRQ